MNREAAQVWYGPLREGWQVRRFKHVARIVGGQVDPTDERYRELPLYAPNHMQSGTGRLLSIGTAEEQAAESGKYLIAAGDVLFSKIRPALRKVVVAPSDGLCSADVYGIRPANGALESRFLFYVLLSQGFYQYSLLESDRVAMPKINREALGECPLVFPSASRQRRIAAFLEQRTAAIDELIAKKERLVELLAEKRQTLITQVVTRGLDPSVPMKDSGVDSLGSMPWHWSLKRLMHLTPRGRSIMYGIVLPGPHVDGGTPIVKSGDCWPEKLRRERLKCTTAEIEAPYARARLEPGDIVYAIRGSIGASAVVPKELRGANLTQDAARIAPGPAVNGAWLLFAVQSQSTWNQLEAGVLGATVKGINIRDLKRPYLPVPPLDEQRAIAELLDRRLATITETLERTEASASRLREYRQAFITAAVTGQLDIGNADVVTEALEQAEAQTA